ncbi:MAG: OsmC family protein [Burkholderiales bacterium]|nr:OsmC family protein [Burkholderiales bacterium]
MSTSHEVQLTQVHDYQFDVRFGNPAIATLRTDEPPPLGQDAGPDPASMLITAVANCLSASLLFAMRKFRNEPSPMSIRASATPTRNERNRLRISLIEVTIRLGQPAAAMTSIERVLAQFEDFCTVTSSVRGAIRVAVTIEDHDGTVLHRSEGTPAAGAA